MLKRIKTLTSLTSVVKIIGHHPRFFGSWAEQNRQLPGTRGRSASEIPRAHREFIDFSEVGQNLFYGDARRNINYINLINLINWS